MTRREPTLADFTDADGYVDYERFDVEWEIWRQHQEFENDQIPRLNEDWCFEVENEDVTLDSEDDPTENDWLFPLYA